MPKNNFASIESIINVAKKGGMFILVDDEKRENEGDLIISTSNSNAKNINFMAKYGRGLICLALDSVQAKRLNLTLMSANNQSRNKTAFTVSIEAKKGITTGISARDRAKTISIASKKNVKKTDIVSPGHVFPIIAKDGGVLVRAGHTEASVDISKLAKKNNSAVICEIMNEDGTMARLPECQELAKKFDLKVVSIADLIEYRLQNETLIEQTIETEINTAFGSFKAIAFRQLTNDMEHLALVKGEWNEEDEVPIRVHSSHLIGDVFQLLDIGKGPKLHAAMQRVEKILHIFNIVTIKKCSQSISNDFASCSVHLIQFVYIINRQTNGYFSGWVSCLYVRHI